jgi:hypothetical protein
VDLLSHHRILLAGTSVEDVLAIMERIQGFSKSAEPYVRFLSGCR